MKIPEWYDVVEPGSLVLVNHKKSYPGEFETFLGIYMEHEKFSPTSSCIRFTFLTSEGYRYIIDSTVKTVSTYKVLQ